MPIEISNSVKPDLASLKIADHKREGRSTGKWLAALVVIGAAAAAVYWGRNFIKSRAPEVEVAAAVAPASAPMPALLNATGYVTPRRRATVAAKITGKIKEVFVDEGVHVKEGQVLATLDDSDYQVSLRSTQADRDATAAAVADLEVQLGNAERELVRSKGLTEAGVQTIQSLDTAQTLVNRLKAQIAQAKSQILAADAKMSIDKQNIDNCVVRSPYTGIVVTKDAQPGEMISPMSAGGGFTRTGICTVVDMTSNEIEVDVNENYIARVKPGQRVSATLDAYPDWQIPSHVRTVIPTADRQKGTVKVRISFDKLDDRILPDMGVKVAFLSDEQTPAQKSAVVAVIPQTAVKTSEGQSAVFLFHNGVLERRAIRTGRDRGTDVEVLAGIAPGDLVVTKGLDNLQDGLKVNRKQ
ncbi:MAG: efflux RND transporter periplasmic adaptor subunit [Candidatus Acidiferrales bacterium]